MLRHLAILLISIILWIISDSATRNPNLAKKILIAVSTILLAWGINELIFFFPFAASFSLLAFALTVIAILQLNAGTKTVMVEGCQADNNAGLTAFSPEKELTQ